MRKDLIFITGATGFVGRHLVNRLLATGANLCILTRNPDRVPPEWKDKITVLTGDLSDEKLRLPIEAGIVFHCGGEIRDKSLFEKTNAEGTRNIVKACLEHKKCKFVHLSSVGVMGSKGSFTVYEDFPCNPQNMYEKTKYEAEKIIQDAVKNSGLDAVILRPSIVYGPGIAKERDSFLALAQAIKRGRFCIFGKNPSYYNIVYVGDVVETLIYLANPDIKVSGEVFIINEAILWRDFAREVFSALKINNQVIKMPGFAGHVLALICEIGKKAGLRMPFSLSRYKAIICKTIFSSEKLYKETGFKIKYGNTEGIKITLREYLEQGLL
jgi:nucleoside-diphosphate-sugar epimerase